VKIDLDLNLRFFSFAELFTNVFDKHAVHVRRKNLSLNLCAKVTNEIKKCICKVFLIKKWAVSSVEGQCKMQKTNAIELVQNDCRLPDQNKITGM